MRFTRSCRFWKLLFLLALLRGVPLPAQEEAGAAQPGLLATFRSDSEQSAEVSETVLESDLGLFVPASQSPSPLLPPGPFSVVWEGTLSMDLRSQYQFEAALQGEVNLEINGRVVLATNAPTAAVFLSPAVRLNKGTNAFRVRFRSPARNDALLRIQWRARGTAFSFPIPTESLASDTAPEALNESERLRFGRALFVEHRCHRCHTGPPAETGMAELRMDAPSFDGIGSRLRFGWMRDWILDPKAHRPTARMPKVFHGPQAEAQAATVAAYLSTLRDPEGAEADSGSAGKAGEAEAVGRGEELFGQLHCAGCHVEPGNDEQAGDRIDLSHVAKKFQPGMLAVFLQRPEAHYSWTRMPNFGLSEGEASDLSAFLESQDGAEPANSEPPPAEVIDRGRVLVETSGCLSCHDPGKGSPAGAPSLAELKGSRQGCLSTEPGSRGRAPVFGFSEEEAEALVAFLASGKRSLERHAAAEFAERQIRNLRCVSCHGELEGAPEIEQLGSKLRPEWAEAFLSGKVPYKPRPWVPARMPAFRAWSKPLAEGMAMANGYPPKGSVEGPVDMELAEIGRRLVSAEGGFACVACHAVGEVAATQGAESPGVNLARSGARLRREYFERWLMNPLLIDPTTKMPVYFDEQGVSPLDVFEGDAFRQAGAIWEYLRLGEKMPAPSTGASP